ncbi:hypothetical protein M0813_04908 [Anaeramoeba flamelloides]|uniref:Homeobox domain-containing protein n=1 Tax=Anaeramoeba flamelloides TaxID=1746091 RepID=A0ABQ8XIE2_9EUKA|nr:hypothetical protein M0813_04908 [Anaeramoeba flamelloides]
MSIFDNDLPTFSWPETDFAQDNLNTQSTNLSSTLLPSPFFEQDHEPKEAIQNMYPFENENSFTSFPPLQETNTSHSINTKDLWSKKAEGFKFEYDQESVATNHFYDDSTNLSSFTLFDANKEEITALDLETQQNGFENQTLPEIEEMKRHNKQKKQTNQKKIFLKKDPLSVKKNQSSKKEKPFQKTSNFVSSGEGEWTSSLKEKAFKNFNNNTQNNYSSQPNSSKNEQLSQSGRYVNQKSLKVKKKRPETTTDLQTNIEKGNCNQISNVSKFKLNPDNGNSNQFNPRKRKKILKFKKKGQYFYFSDKGHRGNLKEKTQHKNCYQIQKKKLKFKNKYRIKKIPKEKEKVKKKEKKIKLIKKQNDNLKKRNTSNSEYFSPTSDYLSFSEYNSSSISDSMSDSMSRSMSESESFSEFEENFELSSKLIQKKERKRTKEQVFGSGSGKDHKKIPKKKINKKIISIKSPNILYKNKKIRLNFKVTRSKSFDYNDLKTKVSQINNKKKSYLKLRMISSSPIQVPTVIHERTNKRKNEKKKQEKKNNEKRKRNKKKISAYYEKKYMSPHHHHHHNQYKKNHHYHHNHHNRHHRRRHHRHHRSHRVNSSDFSSRYHEQDQKHNQNKKKNYKNKNKNQSQHNRNNKYEKSIFKERINSMKKETTVSERMVTSEHARNIFEKWFHERNQLETGPYPDTKTKKKLAKQSNTEIIHVNRWFAQRRRTEKIRCLNGNRMCPAWIKKRGRPRKD